MQDANLKHRFSFFIFLLFASFSSMSQWTANGNNIYYKNGLVGISTNNPAYNLDVAGIVKSQGFYSRQSNNNGEVVLQWSTYANQNESLKYYKIATLPQNQDDVGDF